MRRVVLAAFVSSAFGLTVPACGQAPGDGFRLVMEERSSATGAMAAMVPTGPWRVSRRIRDGVMRTDVNGEQPPNMPKGLYVLTGVGRNDSRMVDTAAKQVVVFTTPAPVSRASAIEMRVTDTSSTIQDLGAGETVFGFPTRKFRVTMQYTIRMGSAEVGHSETVAVKATLHMSEAIAALDPAAAMLREGMLRTPVYDGTINGGDALRALTAVLPKGVALVSDHEVRTNMTGSETVTRYQSRVIEFTRGGVTASEMTVPPAYTVVDLNAMMQRGLDAMQPAAATPATVKPAPAGKVGTPAKPTPR